MTLSPKFNQHIQDRIKQSNAEQATPRYGIIMNYDSTTNTATVQLSDASSDLLGELITNVPCPIVMGVQNVAPEPGRPCWVTYKGDRHTSPIITHYFNHNFQKFDYTRHTAAKNSVPNYHLNM